MQVVLRLRKSWVSFIKQKGEVLLPGLGRELLSSYGALGSSSGSGMWGMQCQLKDNGLTSGLRHEVQRGDEAPVVLSCYSTTSPHRPWWQRAAVAKGTRPLFSWLTLSLPVPLSISTAGCPVLSHTCTCFPAGCKHPFCFPTLL